MAVITALALIVAVGLIIFQVNPQQDTNARNLNAQQRELARQVRDINGIICAQAQTTANAYRFRSLTPSGKAEPIRHFLTRMQAQRQTLQLSRGRDCAVAPGFPPFEFQLERALEQINRILSRFSAKQREPVRRETSHDPFQPYPALPGSDKAGTIGIGEEGVPFLPPKQGIGSHPPHKEPPSAPTTTGEGQPMPPSPVVPAQPAPATNEPTPPSEPETVDLPVLPDLGSIEESLCTAIRQVNDLC